MSENPKAGMTVVVKTVTRLTLGFIMLYGIYVALHAHAGPGGGFAGGVIVALSLVHVMLAFGKDAALTRVTSGMLRFIISLAALVFLYSVTLSLVTRNNVPGAKMIMAHELMNEQVLLPLCETVVVGGGLFAIFIALVLLSKIDKDSE